MPFRKLILVILACAAVTRAAPHAGSPHPAMRAPDTYRYANQLLPAVVSIADQIALAGALEHKRPEYVSLAKEKDEYIYHLPDRVFIRCIKNRYESPSGRVCGDFAIVRVELLDEFMKTIPPIMAWPMVYRENQWQKLVQDEEGRYLWQSFNPIELPPYAARCFDLTQLSGSREPQ
jgi:hypothetical protein